jgi:hypothetical protein
MGEIMKTLGQIACEAFDKSDSAPVTAGDAWPARCWEAAAQAVRQAVIEECANVCELEKVEEIGEGDDAYNLAIYHCIVAVRALNDKP